MVINYNEATSVQFVYSGSDTIKRQGQARHSSGRAGAHGSETRRVSIPALWAPNESKTIKRHCSLTSLS